MLPCEEEEDERAGTGASWLDPTAVAEAAASDHEHDLPNGEEEQRADVVARGDVGVVDAEVILLTGSEGADSADRICALVMASLSARTATARRAPTVAMMEVAVGSRGGKDGNLDSNSGGCALLPGRAAPPTPLAGQAVAVRRGLAQAGPPRHRRSPAPQAGLGCRAHPGTARPPGADHAPSRRRRREPGRPRARPREPPPLCPGPAAGRPHALPMATSLVVHLLLFLVS